MPPQTFALRAMTRFRCIGGECEDTCCSGLLVSVDEAWMRRVEALGVAECLEHVVEEPEGGPVIDMGEDGACPFLAPDRLCSLQRAHGEAALPAVCATFPRLAWRAGERVELSGTFACPEVVREVLLGEDAVALVPFDAGHLVPALSLPDLAAAEPDVWHQQTLLIKDALLALLDRQQFPRSTRIGFLAHLGFVLGAPEHLASKEALEQTLARFGSDEVLLALHRQVAAVELPRGPTLGIHLALIRSRLGSGRGARYEKLAGAVVAGLGDPREPQALEEAAGLLLRRRAVLAEQAGPLVGRAFENALRHHLCREPLALAENLLSYAFRLAFRLSLVETMLLAHPETAAFCEGEGGDLARALVESFQVTARNLEQAPAVRELLEEADERDPEETLGRALVFATY